MLSGVNVKATLELAKALTIPIIASGGVASLDDVQALCEIEAEGIMGVITGRAIYEGSLDFKKAQILADKLSMKA
jgi:phosphoribosylformimino-5-aminoimidazole carboxamide ribotide isomerase